VPVTTSNTSTTTTTTTTTTSGKTLSDLLGLSSNTTSINYDLLVSGQGIPAIATKVWVKKNKMRTEMTLQGQVTVLLLDTDAKTMYTYMPAQNTAIKMTWNPTTKSATDQAKSVSDYNPTIVGTETIDGKVCTVVQYTVQGQTAKMWLWQDYGFPIRVEATTAQGTTVIEYKNIQFVDIPDSMFTLPDGVQITQMPGP
jgi:outer membrane lipoprotein-sorting protein